MYLVKEVKFKIFFLKKISKSILFEHKNCFKNSYLSVFLEVEISNF